MKMTNNGKVPSLGNLQQRLPTSRSEVASVMSGFSDDSARMDELSKVKQELEEALRQVKIEMKDGGATKSQFGASTVRSQSVMSDASRYSSVSRQSGKSRASTSVASSRPDTAMSSSSIGTDFLMNNLTMGGGEPRLQAGINKKPGSNRLATNRGRVKANLGKDQKPLVSRPVKENRNVLPAPSPSAFRHQTHVTTNQSEYKPLGPAKIGTNQGPARAPGGRRKEHSRMFSKECEAQVASSAITGSTVFATRVCA